MTKREQQILEVYEMVGNDAAKAACLLNINVSSVERTLRAIRNGGQTKQRKAARVRKKASVRPYMLFGDCHAPFTQEGALDFLSWVHDHYNCQEHVYCTGDLFDFHSMSRHLNELDAISPDEEYEKALLFADELGKLFPNGTLVTGNHDAIPQRQLKELGVSHKLLKDPRDIYGLPEGWSVEPLFTTIKDDGLDVLIEHGIQSNGVNGAINTAMAKGCSFAQGHVHSFAGVSYRASHFDLKFGLNTGCLADHNSLAMRYGKYNKFKGVLGCGLVYPANGIVNAHATFIPMDA